eukprot:gene17503-23815_t
MPKLIRPIERSAGTTGYLTGSTGFLEKSPPATNAEVMKQRAASILEEMAHSRPPVQLLLLIICLLSFVHSETVPKVLSSKVL